ncbi:uridine kinase [Propionicimonas sp.]|uniref:uridine kinase family protein n=1 Tax=Propionicimonas sp. TaxID=1955623 RepID=UPI001DD7C284|nr:uridine kinase [Propionicimonas sp.]MBU3977075.1 uridine kinase [Actinomycetota bacterium]MBU3985015.1 uridine kinase [Actinomycetota bacterium]MBU4007028.1 uridine kinase [Actinomycetota bacterium]MBU4064781.1 uridine kinase [Actinomycetota bacterium]MBU4094293.1 uridine kinase [Actinomycetota bacterium]
MNRPAQPRLVLIAGPSGSGKSRLMHASGLPCLRLDDFYFDADHPGMPTTNLGITDWDDPRSWDAEAALAGLRQLLETGEFAAPAYSISESRRVGTRPVSLDGAGCLGVEGIFAIEFLQHCRQAKLSVEAIYLDRPAALVYLLRLRRDLAHKRKPPHIAVRRGWALARAQAGLRRRALAAGFEPLGMKAAISRIGHLTRPSVAACATGQAGHESGGDGTRKSGARLTSTRTNHPA